MPEFQTQRRRGGPPVRPGSAQDRGPRQEAHQNDPVDLQGQLGNTQLQDLVRGAATPTGPQIDKEKEGAKESQTGKKEEQKGDELDLVRKGEVLSEGMSGPAVEALQRLLAKAGVSVQASGVMDKATVAAVRTFQKGRTQVNGLVGPTTLKAIEAAIDLGDLNRKIFNQTLASIGVSTKAGPERGKLACAWAVNNILELVLGRRIGSNPNYVPSLETELEKVGALTKPGEARPGDLVIASDQSHIGIYIGNGRVISNSSSKASFSWESNLNFDGFYGGGTSRIYRVTR